MRETLEKIFALQDVNREIDQLRSDRDRLAIDVDYQARSVDKKRQRAREVHSRRLELTREADRAQLQIEEAEEENRRLHMQLNVIKHQKEYDALQHSILSRRADIQKWEDEALSALEAVDDLSKEERRLAEQIGEGAAELESIKNQVARQTEEYDRRIEQIAQERDRIRRQIGPEILSAYDRLAVRHPQNALAAVKGRICRGCYTQITKQTEVLLMRDAELVYCHSCGRMLMLTD